jgi:UDP-glucose-4-epimerase GalE
MRILVTGGAGYIGSHTCKSLASVGHAPIVLDDLRMGHAHNVRWGPLVQCDLANRDLLTDILRDYHIEAVIHLAADALVGESIANPGKYFRGNVMNSLNVLDAMVETGVDTFVFSSTCAVYGGAKRIPIDEDHLQEPLSPYGESKLMIERAVRWYGQAHGLKWVSLRYFNAAGADPDGELGEEHDPETHIIPSVILTALGLRSRLTIFGTDHPTPDGTAIRDYIHVTDLAEAHIKALELLNIYGTSIAVNVGTGLGISIREVIRAVEQVAGCPVTTVNAARRPGDPSVLVADASRATTVLDWRPQYSSLNTIVETAWRWHSERANTLSPGC